MHTEHNSTEQSTSNGNTTDFPANVIGNGKWRHVEAITDAFNIAEIRRDLEAFSTIRESWVGLTAPAVSTNSVNVTVLVFAVK